MRRIAAGTTAAVLTAGMLVLGVAQPAAACACGAPMPPEGVDVSVGEERALVSWDGATERIDMMLDLLADGAETGLVMPTPTPATVSLGDRALFEAAVRQTEPVVRYEEDWWGGGSFGDAMAPGGGAPEVLSEVDLGPVQAVTLAADDAEGLRLWLDENGYGIRADVAALLQDYIDRGWYFAALKLSGEEPLDGLLDPVRFEFAVDRPVYPLLLSQAASIPQTVKLYLFGEDRYETTFLDAPDASTFGAVTWAGPVTQPELAGLGDYLTVWEGYFGAPGTQIVGDLALEPTGGREDMIAVQWETRYVTVGGVPLGWLLVGLGLAAFVVLLGAGILVAVLVRRRPSVE